MPRLPLRKARAGNAPPHPRAKAAGEQEQPGPPPHDRRRMASLQGRAGAIAYGQRRASGKTAAPPSGGAGASVSERISREATASPLYLIQGRYSVRVMETRTEKHVPFQPVPLEIGDSIRHNCRVKTYPDGSRSVLVADRAIFREPGYELASDRLAAAERQRRAWQAEMERRDAAGFDVGELSGYANERHLDAEAQRKADSLARAQRRAKAAVRDLAASNDFRWFVTLTLSPEKINRYDVKEITRRLNHWLDNHVRRSGLAYVLVPERHKDGAIHFHGLFNDVVEAVDSGHRDSGGHAVYNLPEWDLGFTTAIELYGERRQAVAYVCKYIGKQMNADGTPGKVGGRWYYSGGKLQRPRMELFDVDPADFAEVEGFSFTVDALGATVTKFDMEGGEEDGRQNSGMAAEDGRRGASEALEVCKCGRDADGRPGEDMDIHGRNGIWQSRDNDACDAGGVRRLRRGHPPGSAGV